MTISPSPFLPPLYFTHDSRLCPVYCACPPRVSDTTHSPPDSPFKRNSCTVTLTDFLWDSVGLLLVCPCLVTLSHLHRIRRRPALSPVVRCKTQRSSHLPPPKREERVESRVLQSVRPSSRRKKHPSTILFKPLKNKTKMSFITLCLKCIFLYTVIFYQKFLDH